MINEVKFEKKIPTRMFCSICGGAHKIDFWVPDDIWKESIPERYWLSPVCLNCFTARADEKFLPWDNEIQFKPCSFVTQRMIQAEVEFCTCNPEYKTGSTSAMHCNHCGKVEPSETWLRPEGWGWGKSIEMPLKPS